MENKTTAPSPVAATPNPGGGIDIVALPHFHAHSALDGLHYEAIDADAEAATAIRLSTLTQNGQRLVGVLPFHTAMGKPANLIITQDDHALPKG